VLQYANFRRMRRNLMDEQAEDPPQGAQAEAGTRKTESPPGIICEESG
jgi:hypothetical protein